MVLSGLSPSSVRQSLMLSSIQWAKLNPMQWRNAVFNAIIHDFSAMKRRLKVTRVDLYYFMNRKSMKLRAPDVSRTKGKLSTWVAFNLLGSVPIESATKCENLLPDLAHDPQTQCSQLVLLQILIVGCSNLSTWINIVANVECDNHYVPFMVSNECMGSKLWRLLLLINDHFDEQD